MASFRKRGKSWEAFVSKNGIRKTASFDTKAEATAWAARIETEILARKNGDIPDIPFSDLLARYRDNVSITKRGKQWEFVRINKIIRDDKIAHVRLPDLSAVHVAEWRNFRLQEVGAASVNREWNLLSHCCSIAVKEWQWLTSNPFSDVKRPPKPEARTRLVSDDEIERLLFALGYTGTPPQTITARVGAAFLFAIETAMRAGEICGLQWRDVETERRFLRITGTAAGAGKTAAAKREVPLTPRAIEIIEQMRHIKSNDSVFDLKSSQIDILFRKAKARSLIDDLHFHDSRAEAITRLSKKLDILSLARMVGHRDLRMLQVYYRETAENIAKRF